MALPTNKVLSFVAVSLVHSDVYETFASQVLLTHVGDRLPFPATGMPFLLMPRQMVGKLWGLTLPFPKRKDRNVWGFFFEISTSDKKKTKQQTKPNNKHFAIKSQIKTVFSERLLFLRPTISARM